MFQPTYRVLRTVLKIGLILIIGLAAAVLAGTVWSALHARDLAPAVEHAGPTLQQVRSLAALVTTRVTLADATTAEITGRGGSMSAVLVIRGDALVSIDLEKARVSAMDASARTLVLDLPQPVVIQARVDHQGTRVFAIQRHGFWRLMRLDDVTRQLVDTGLREAQQTIERVAGDEGILTGAREHARQVLSAFAQSTGWQLTIRWDVPPEKP